MADNYETFAKLHKTSNYVIPANFDESINIIKLLIIAGLAVPNRNTFIIKFRKGYKDYDC